MMNSSADIASATTLCDIELKPFALALHRQHPSQIVEKEWRGRTGGSWTSPLWQGKGILWSKVAIPAGNTFETRGMRSRNEVSAEFVELGVMGQWYHRLEDRREACSSMQRRRW